jgi:hypothetical protein
MKQSLGDDPLAMRRLPHDRNLGGFQTVWLNLYGWSALVGTGLVIGAVAGFATPVPLWIALIAGVLATWGVLLILDHRRFLNSTIHLSDDRFDRESGAAVVDHLRGLGVATSYEEHAFDGEGETYVQRGIVCRQRDIEKVQQVMSEHLT